jgi:alkylation response protein AidB-like acyl-CoA dehydrogenase
VTAKVDQRSPSQVGEEARRWLASADIPVVPVDFDQRFDVLRYWQRTLYEAGWLGMDWAVESGGRGLTARHQFAFVSELARAHAPTPIGLIGLDVVGPTINAFGTLPQRATYLPPLLSGAEIWCQGFSEPGAGSDLASLRTVAAREGDHYVVNGQKVWTSWARQASWCALLCRTGTQDQPRHKGLSYLIVDMASPGITVRPIIQMTGDAEFNEVFFDDVRVPVGNLIGAENDGWRIAMDTLSRERGNYAMRRLIDVGWLYDEAVRRLAELPAPRRSHGRIPESIGEAHIALQVLEAQIRLTVERLAAETGPTAHDSIDKLVLNEAEQTVCSRLADLLGAFRIAPQSRPLGLDGEQIVHDHYFSRAASIYGGTSQIQRNIVAERMLGLPKG